MSAPTEADRQKWREEAAKERGGMGDTRAAFWAWRTLVLLDALAASESDRDKWRRNSASYRDDALDWKSRAEKAEAELADHRAHRSDVFGGDEPETQDPPGQARATGGAAQTSAGRTSP